MVSRGLLEFIEESNRIEGIHRAPTDEECLAHIRFLGCAAPTAADMKAFVAVVAPGKPLRQHEGMNVRVGGHVAPPGGPEIEGLLEALLDDAANGRKIPYETHQLYERLHPFMDGNGRSGRVLWLWCMDYWGDGQRALSLGFLHNWYYQSLAYRFSTAVFPVGDAEPVTATAADPRQPVVMPPTPSLPTLLKDPL